jgi:Zn-dependent protease
MPTEPYPNPLEFVLKPFSVCSLAGVRIWAHPILPGVTACFVCYTAYVPGPLSLLLSLLLHGPILWLSLLLHELCHCSAARLLGFEVSAITLWPLGGLDYVARSSYACADAAIAVAGPLANVALLLALLALRAVCDRRSPSSHPSAVAREWSELLDVSVMMQQLLLLGNLLPCAPLDGGRLLADVLLARGHTAHVAARLMVLASLPVLAGLLCVATYLLAYSANGGLVVGCAAVWMALTIKDLHDVRALGLAHTHLLFAGAIAAGDESATAAEAARSTTGPVTVEGASLGSAEATASPSAV